MDQTHDPARTSWVPSAEGHPEFPIQNLPLGIFHRVDDKDDPSPARVGMAIGDCLGQTKRDGEVAVNVRAVGGHVICRGHFDDQIGFAKPPAWSSGSRRPSSPVLR